MGRKHALLSASGAGRWLECTPSARLEEQFQKTSSFYADEGTAAHDLAELAARHWLGEIPEKTYENKLAKFVKNEYYNAEMLECAIDYGKYISETVEATRQDCADAFVELEVTGLDFSEWAPEGFGTGDCIIVADDLLEIIDFKYGKGVRVDATNNAQMRLYALGAVKRYGDLYDIKRVRVSIIQPRITTAPSTEELTLAELIDWAENYVKPRAALAYAGEGEFNPSDETCKFCRAKAECRARAEKNLKLFDDAPDLLLVTPDEAGEILEKAADIRAWLTDLEGMVMTALFGNAAVKGWKLVEGRSNRKYVDDLQVAEAMKSAGYEEAALYERKLLGITAMESAFGKKTVSEVLKDLIYKPPGKPTLAPESDKRPAFTPESMVLDAFDDIEE